MALPPEQEDTLPNAYSHTMEAGRLTKPVADAIATLTSENSEDIQHAASQIAFQVVGLKRAKALKKPPTSSRELIKRLSKTLSALSKTLQDIEASLEVSDALHWETLRSVYEDQAGKLPVSGVITRPLGRHIVVPLEDLPDAWNDENCDDLGLLIDSLSQEDRAAFRDHVETEHWHLLEDFRATIEVYRKALKSEALNKIGGQGQKRDIPLDGFIYRVASISLHHLPDAFRISDSPSSPFFRLLDQLLVLAGIERSDRTIRDRIANIIYETRADKWWEKA